MNSKQPVPRPVFVQTKTTKAKTRRGRLKIFFGAAAGVGKSYAMLLAARERQRDNIDVVIGWINPHAYQETEAMMSGLEILPLRYLKHQGLTRHEFDIDAALKRRPALLLLDELAHTNAPGSRHPKRWQDIQELLDAGIDVYTTLNVQHLESLNDDIRQILGIRVSDTLPDTVFEAADEVILVDLPADDLLLRLKQGKVLIPPAEQAASHDFYRKGNLIALRELALRQTVSRVGAQMLKYRERHQIHEVWQIGERILVCIAPNALAERLVRAGKRLANSLSAEWVVVYVETPKLARLPAEKRDGILRILRLAEQLGAETATLSAAKTSEVIIRFASERNINKIVMGKPSRRGWKRWLLGSVVDALISDTHNVSVYLLGSPSLSERETLNVEHALFNDHALPGLQRQLPGNIQQSYPGYIWAIIVTLISALFSHVLFGRLELSNQVMVFLLGVVFVATRYGRGPSILASILGVGIFDLFFVDPYLSLSPADSQYLITLAAMLIVAMVISNLMVNVRAQAKIAAHRERRAAALYAMSKELAVSQTETEIVSVAVRHLYAEFSSHTLILFPNDAGLLTYPKQASLPQSLRHAELDVAQWVFEHNQMAGQGTHTLSDAAAVYFPIHDENNVLGVLALLPVNLRRVFLPEQQKLLETFLRQIAQALSRIRFAEQAKRTQMQIETERLRNSLLSAISHDLRTPLATIIGSASALADDDGHLQAHDKLDLSRAIVDEAERMTNLVNNLLDMARLDAGVVELNKQWYPVEEIIGSVLTRMKKALANRYVKVNMPPDIPMLQVDAVMIEQVLINLMENAVRYTPAGSNLEIMIETSLTSAQIAVADHGPGIPPGLEEKLFEKFYQTQNEAAQSGVGLGLAICRAIVEAHGGGIRAQNRPEGGAMFVLELPFDQAPPVLAPEE